MKVRAKEFGIYRGGRVRAGVIFDLVEGDKLMTWMQPVDATGEAIRPSRPKPQRQVALSEMTPKGAALPGTAPASSAAKTDTGDLLR